MKSNLVTLIFICITCSVFAQDIEISNGLEEQVYFEKLYIHTDRELYSPGDTIWLKSYLVSGLTHKLSPDYRNIYVQLISKTGEVVANRLLLSKFGEAHGDIALADTLPEGQYMLRARTKYLENFGEGSFFHKRLWVNKAKSSLELDIPEDKAPEEIEAMYFPESGNLVLNAPNQVAFKVIGTDGRGVEASGAIINQQSDTITKFSTSFLGMGRFVMMPKEGEKYYAIIDNHPDSKQELSNILEDGFALNFKDEGSKVLFTVSRDFKKTGKTRVYLSASHKGVDLFHEPITIDGFTGAISLNKNRFLRGINKITLSDSYYNVLAERLVFIDTDFGNTFKVEVGKKEYSTREKVSLELEPILPANDKVTSTLSVSVISEDYFGAVGPGQNIKSYLLLDSELKGEIELPALYFVDEENITAKEKLDLLMMVQGWRSYYWDEIVEKDPRNLTGLNDAGLTISGHVKKLFGVKSITGGNVVFTSISPSLMLQGAVTDSLGNFKFEHLFLADSAEVMLSATNEKGKKRVEVILDSIKSSETFVDTSLFNQIPGGIGIPMKYYRSIYLKEMALKKYNMEEGTIVLDEVTVISLKKQWDEILNEQGLLAEPDVTIEMDEDFISYPDIIAILSSRVAGVVETNNGKSISIRGGGSPLFLLDGIETTLEMILYTPLQDIDRIEILKGGYGMAAYGSKGGNGVVGIFTKHGKVEEEKDPYLIGRDVFKVGGFQQANKFYSPKYTLENIGREEPDYRPTLFWSPEVEINNGKGAIEFFTCDNLSRYLVVVEGISKKGNICFGVGNFSVTSRIDN